ncbi:RNA 2',3'-cyclic phosphodiesterase [Oceanobacillus halophilus]|uniref:RNA 2',3'-cyclic phosphodiesterase n=1 Tax=Oceanobacillus halophilus TaxID=930130 RepID=A0A494ZUH2_9BACI|nr:RNA 2',3'-cyclic phosphodiesterase [Oceanobacillus halophilus]RKQ29685.1 RNA 2',3'-cyclic phosphodiesterase [Oceanobacillus halophilus]
MSGAPHYFIGIHLPEELQNYFSKWQEALTNKLPYKQWYNKKDLHITLKFLGAMEEEKLDMLSESLLSAKNFSSFDIQLGGIGTFGNPTKPRVLWAGVQKNDRLEELHHLVEQRAAQLGFPKENRIYRPHITLAKRWKAHPQEDYTDSLTNIQKQYTETKIMHVGEVIVFQIHPGRKQKYEPVKTYVLRKVSNS